MNETTFMCKLLSAQLLTKNIPCIASRYSEWLQLRWALLREIRFSIPTISHKTNPTKIFSRCWQWILSPLLLQREDSPLHSWRGIFTRSSNFKQAWQRNKVQTFYDRQKNGQWHEINYGVRGDNFQYWYFDISLFCQDILMIWFQHLLINEN